jgi:ubiquinone/menaquinone biosynthesis C-methylase UbiE
VSEYETRKKKELARFRKVESQHQLPPAQVYWAQRYLRPKLRAVGFDSVRRVYLDTIAGLCGQNPGELVEVISVGAGNCDHEVRLATALRGRGIENFRIDCLEMNPDMLERGRKAAAERGLIGNLGFVAADVKEWDVAGRHYSACLAIQALHHFVELEAAFTKARQVLAPGGVFVVNDMIGRNGHKRWPEALPYIQEIWSQMPDRYKYHHRLNRFDPEYVDRDWSQKTFEGVRAQDILPLLMQFFHFEVFVAVRNIIDPFISRGYGPNLDLELPDDRAFIDRVAELDDRLIDEGTVKPTQLIACLRTEPVSHLRRYRHWTPEHCVRPPDAGEDSARVPDPNHARAVS